MQFDISISEFYAKISYIMDASLANNHSSDAMLPKMKPRFVNQTPKPAPINSDSTLVSNSEYSTSRENSEFFPTRAKRIE